MNKHRTPIAILGLLSLSLIAADTPGQSGLIRPLDPVRLGTTVRLRLAAPSSLGLAYQMGCSLPTTPPVVLGDGRILPVGDDGLLAWSLDPQNSAIQNWSGTLDGLGQGLATVDLPSDPTLDGLPLALGFVTFDASTGVVSEVSQPLRVPLRSAPLNADFSPVTARLQQGVVSGEVPGASLLIVHEGAVVYQEVFGSFTLQTEVPTASASKGIAALVLMTLVDDGILDLDDPISLYYPLLVGPKRDITVRQLFAHISGLPTGAPCLSSPNTQLQTCAAQILLEPLIAAPGSGFAYGGASMHVAGAIAEILLGQAGGIPSWDQRFQDRIAQPLGLTTMSYNSTTNPRVAGGIRSNLQDLGPVLEMMLGLGDFRGNTVMNPRSVARMVMDDNSAVPVITSPGAVLNAQSTGIAFWRTGLDSNGGAFEVSSMGAFGSVFWVDFTRGYGAFLMTLDNGTEDAAQIRADILPALRAIFE